eukprot:CAMPEP_0179150706 /NCGR_PEP_ID=MMETSP0796-20121207/73112_1 /TAXON_ID=73915 /ORGANISM="Pyrodinium bahamense, Strain pbaha01" /LENGTH=63 /DNA_ID=CAMNT_0020851713 /DNA_START=156 /DNA_END=343 /DNA_ORIENTATION=-
MEALTNRSSAPGGSMASLSSQKAADSEGKAAPSTVCAGAPAMVNEPPGQTPELAAPLTASAAV